MVIVKLTNASENNDGLVEALNAVMTAYGLDAVSDTKMTLEGRSVVYKEVE